MEENLVTNDRKELLERNVSSLAMQCATKDRNRINRTDSEARC